MVGRRVYDLMYRFWAPWDAVGVRPELREFLGSGGVSPATHPRAVDLGCGTGANVVHLADQGFDATGLDFSPVALAKARARAERAGVEGRCRFIEADLTAGRLPQVDGPFDLLLDFGTLDDLDHDGRRAMAANAARLARPGAVFLFWCFHARRADLPRMSFSGPSRVAPAVEPGEEVELFGDAFDIEPGPAVSNAVRAACFVLTRR